MLSLVVSGLMLACLSAPLPAAAQAAPADDDAIVDVRDRARPELEPLGFRLGSFLVYPTATLGLEFDDNLFRRAGERRDSLILRGIPAFRLQSDWNNHALDVSGSLDVGQNLSGETEHFVDGAIAVAGRIDVRRETQLFGGVLYEDLHEDRGSPELGGTGAFSSLRRLTANAGIRQRWNRWMAIAEARYATLDFRDSSTLDSAGIDNSDRDRDVYIVAGRLGLEVLQGYEAFVRATLNERAYRSAVDGFGIDRDSSGYEAVAGVALELTPLLSGEAYVGYREQYYVDPRLEASAGITFGAKLTSNIGPLTTLKLEIDRDIEDTNLTSGSGFFDTTVRLSADHELLRNLVLSGALEYSWQDYQGIDRSDDVLRATVAANYTMNRYLTLGLVCDHEERQSTGRAAGPDYAANRVLLKMTWHP